MNEIEEDISAHESYHKSYIGELNKYPHCSDPDHPGCVLCEDGEEHY